MDRTELRLVRTSNGTQILRQETDHPPLSTVTPTVPKSTRIPYLVLYLLYRCTIGTVRGTGYEYSSVIRWRIDSSASVVIVFHHTLWWFNLYDCDKSHSKCICPARDADHTARSGTRVIGCSLMIFCSDPELHPKMSLP